MLSPTHHFPPEEAKARESLTCPACGAPKARGDLVCWRPCFRGPGGLKYAGLSFPVWLKQYRAAPALP